jgi:hypothetical protein
MPDQKPTLEYARPRRWKPFPWWIGWAVIGAIIILSFILSMFPAT